MIRALPPLGLLTLVAAFLLLPEPRLAALPVQGGVQKSILVTVVAPASAPIKDLGARDFVLREDNATREVTGAELSNEPLFISILVDTSQPRLDVPPATQDLRTALGSFVKTVQAGSPDAQFSIMEFGGAAVPTVPFTAQHSELDKGIKRLVPNQRAGAVLLEALVDTGKSLSDKPTPRRAIVSIDFDPQETSSLQPKRVIEDVHKSGATVWAISIQQSTAAGRGAERDDSEKRGTAIDGGDSNGPRIAAPECGEQPALAVPSPTCARRGRQ